MKGVQNVCQKELRTLSVFSARYNTDVHKIYVYNLVSGCGENNGFMSRDRQK